MVGQPGALIGMTRRLRSRNWPTSISCRDAAAADTSCMDVLPRCLPAPTKWSN